MILLKSLKLLNFLSHENTEIEFGETEKLLVDGNSGSGKSSLFEAIIWSLYGVGRSNNTSLVRHGAKKATVILELTNEGKVYTIERSVLASGKHTLTVKIDGVSHPYSGLKELQAWIETELIGASYLLFVNSIAYLQGGAETFVTQTAARRKELLLEIVRAGDFDVYYEKTKKVIAKCDVDHAVAAEKVIAQSKKIANTELEIATKEEVTKEYATAKLEKDALTGKLQDLMVKERELESVREAHEKSREAITTLGADIERIERRLRDIKQAKDKLVRVGLSKQEKLAASAMLAIAESNIAAAEGEIIADVETEKARSKKFSEKPTIGNHESMIQHYRTLQASYDTPNTCPAGNDCPHHKQKIPLMQECTIKILEHTDALVLEQKALEKWEEEYNAMPSAPEAHVRFANLESLKKNREGIIANLKELETIINEEPLLTEMVSKEEETQKELTEKEALYEKEKENRNKIAEKIALTDTAMFANDVAHVRFGIESASQREVNASARLQRIKELEDGLAADRVALVALEHEVTDIDTMAAQMNLLKEAFGSKGMKSVVIDYILPNLEERINDTLGKMSDFRVHLDTQMEKLDGEGNKEGLFITIINEMGEEMPYESYSGGEKLKVVVAISEALATLQKVGFRLFDEVFVGLDENSTESFVGVMDQFQNRFAQIMCISHLDQIKSSFEKKVVVTKHNGISCLS